MGRESENNNSLSCALIIVGWFTLAQNINFTVTLILLLTARLDSSSASMPLQSNEISKG